MDATDARVEQHLGQHLSCDSPDDSQSSVNIRAFPAFPQERCEVRMAMCAELAMDRLTRDFRKTAAVFALLDDL